MQIDRILYPITTLGPGKRLVIWTIGCSKHCYNCANPELWSKNQNKNIDVFELIKTIKQTTNNQFLEGITITGGDPFEQIDELCILLSLLRDFSNDILVYTGYTYDEIKSQFSRKKIETIMQYISVLIDGVYMDNMNDNKCVLRGSTNQNIIYFDKSKKERYSAYLKDGRKIQNVFYNKKMISIGIHNKDL